MTFTETEKERPGQHGREDTGSTEGRGQRLLCALCDVPPALARVSLPGKRGGWQGVPSVPLAAGTPSGPCLVHASRDFSQALCCHRPVLMCLLVASDTFCLGGDLVWHDYSLGITKYQLALIYSYSMSV